MVAIAAGPLSADTIVLKDGKRVSGQVKLCDDEVCVAGSTRVPRTDIAAILLGNAKMPESGSAGSIVLQDGTVQRGHFDSLTLGFATLGGTDIDRANVAAIIVADIIPPKKDTIVLRDGTSKSGTIVACDAASCTIDGTVVPRDSTRWIGLAQDGSPPAAPAEDTIFLSNGTTMSARLSGLGSLQAHTTHGNVARKAVTWIYVADAPVPANSSGMVDVTPPTQTPDQTTPPPPPPPPPTKKDGRHQPPPAHQPHSSNCRPGKLWTGKIKAHAWGNADNTRFDLKVDADVRMQETICEVPGGGSVSRFDPSGSTVHNALSELNPSFTCKAEGSTPADANQRAQVIYRNSSANSTMGSFGFEIPKGKSLYSVGLGTPGGSSMTLTCTTGASETPIIGSPIAGRSPLRPGKAWVDTEIRYLQDGKMIGSVVAPASTPFERVAFSWAICPVGMECSLPPLPDDNGPQPPPAASNDPCDELKSLIGQMKQLADTYKEFERDYKEAVQKRDKARDEIWGAGGALRKFFSALGELAGAGAGEGAKALKMILKYATAAANDSLYGEVKALGYGPNDLLMNADASAAVKAATQEADKVLEETGSDSAALRTYAESIEKSEALAEVGEKVHQAVEVATGVKEYAETTNELADLIQDYLEERENANREQDGMNDVQNRMDELQQKITDARNRLTGPCPGTGSRLGRDGAFRYAVLRGAPVGIELVQNRGGAGPAAKLNDVRARLAQASSRLGSAKTWLYPFALDVAMSPRLQSALIARALPDLRAASENIDAAVQESQPIESDVRATVPPNATTASGPGSHPSSYR